ncbi:MAG: glycosyltransferase [Chloroflexi bacterium]|nr:glycosyltransferase [Chloroflexota bacterium]MCI0574639.1 glycosyltransferase [Chloroflexota bacterium]MCI0649079.1 glycosyltransferase [Chloroflexota bacterium]MCI0730534.1 glycosyltransferase [Chloroflexota bacterium]
MRSQTFLWLSTTDWDAPQFGSRQQLALCLAGRGHQVLFVEVPRSLHSFISDPAGTRRALKRLGRLRPIAGRIQAYTPWPVLPVYYHPAGNAINQRLLRLDLRRALRRLGRPADVLWTYWPNTAYLVGRLGERLAVYHCIDDFTAVSYPLSPAGAIARMEADLCRRADLVLTRTETLAEARRACNPHTHFLPGGVDVDHFNPARVEAPAADVAALPRPRVGFVGTIDNRLDVAALVACAQALPHVSFVLAGPVKRHLVELDPLQGLSNVYFLPVRPYAAVPAVIAGLDVGFIPYRRTPYTEGLSPLKLYEYLAMGKPVVAADLPYLRREAAHVHLARTAEEYVAAIQERLARPATPQEQSRWAAVASAYSWESQTEEIERLLAAASDG